MGEQIKTMEEIFKLPNKKVTVKYIKRRRGMATNVDDNHVIAGGMLSGATKRYTVPLKRNGGLFNVLTNAEKNYLESENALRGADLSIYGKFWNDYYVTLYKRDNILDLSDPYDYISYKILLSLKDDIASSWKTRNNKASYDFVIVEEGAELKENKKKYDAKKQAFKIYGKIEDDREQLLGILKLITNRPISNNSKLDWIQGQVEEYIDNSPSKFLDLVNDGSFHTKILINKGVELGVITKESNKYITADGLPLCEADEVATFNNAIKYLDSPKNQEVRSLVEAKINNAE